MQSVDRYLRKRECTFSLLNDKELCEVQDILKKKCKHLKAIGKGNKPNGADALTDEAVRVKGGMSLRNGMWHGLRNDIIMRNVIYAE